LLKDFAFSLPGPVLDPFRMSPFVREAALHAYLRVTWRHRQNLVQRFRNRRAFPGAVLFYHRVADTHPNDWTISNHNFVRHIDWLSEQFQFVSLEETLDAQRDGARDQPTVHITFDDGYADNLRVALPELIRRAIPTTYFVSTRFIEDQVPFPHDVDRGFPLATNSIDDVQSLADAGITIGSHSHSHVDFGRPLTPSELRREIVDVRKKLQDWTGQSIDYFAFPYGQPANISQAAIDVVFEAGYRAFVSASGGFNFPRGDSHHVQRIHADPGMAALMNWLTFDPRKTMRPSPIQYVVPSPEAAELIPS
jgi:peptidoglycan/xylan/chitin deacetylase (PgdA/CDA1 family)